MEIENTLKAFFEHQANKVDLTIDVEKAVMAKIAEPKRRAYSKRILSFAVIITLILTHTSIAYGNEIIQYIKNMEFFNNKSEVEWSINTEAEDYGFYKQTAIDVFESLDLDQGKAVAIYVSKDNPKQIVTSIENPLTVQDITLLNSYRIGALDLSFHEKFLPNYQFTNGKITFDMLSQNIDQEAMIEEARITGKNVIIREIPVSSDVISIACEYSNESKAEKQPSFTVVITKWNGNEVIKSESEEDSIIDYEQVMIGSSEVLYENLLKNKKISWVEKECYYQVQSQQATMTKEQLLEIAEIIKLNK